MTRRTLERCAFVAASLLTAGAPAAGWAQAADTAHGKTLFQQRCSTCHNVTGASAGVGPNLGGVVGRRAGSLKFIYSPALKASGIVWTAGALDSFLTSPAKKVPGTRMPLSVPKPEDRRDIIAYLGTTKQ